MTAGTENETHTWFCSYRAWTLCGTSNIFERTHSIHWTLNAIFLSLVLFRAFVGILPYRSVVHQTNLSYIERVFTHDIAVNWLIHSSKWKNDMQQQQHAICYAILSLLSFDSIHFKKKEENYESSVGSSWLVWLKMNNVVANELWIKLNE